MRMRSRAPVMFLPCIVFGLVVIADAQSCGRPVMGNCSLFPIGTPFLASVRDWSVHPNSSAAVLFLNRTSPNSGQLRPAASSLVWDGSRGGVPINIVDSRITGWTDVVFDGPWASGGTMRLPLPLNFKIEGEPNPQGAWDKHLVLLDNATCLLYETIQYRNYLGVKLIMGGVTYNTSDRVPLAAPPARPYLQVFSNAGATASELPIAPAVFTYEEAVIDGCIPHSIGCVLPLIKNTFVWPASGTDGRSNETDAIPMGAYLRLRVASLEREWPRLGRASRVIATALKDHGTIVMDTTSPIGWAVKGTPDARWNDTDLATLRSFHALDFEWVQPPSWFVEGSPSPTQVPPSSTLPSNHNSVAPTTTLLISSTVNPPSSSTFETNPTTTQAVSTTTMTPTLASNTSAVGGAAEDSDSTNSTPMIVGVVVGVVILVLAAVLSAIFFLRGPPAGRPSATIDDCAASSEKEMISTPFVNSQHQQPNPPGIDTSRLEPLAAAYEAPHSEALGLTEPAPTPTPTTTITVESPRTSNITVNVEDI